MFSLHQLFAHVRETCCELQLRQYSSGTSQEEDTPRCRLAYSNNENKTLFDLYCWRVPRRPRVLTPSDSSNPMPAASRLFQYVVLGLFEKRRKMSLLPYKTGCNGFNQSPECRSTGMVDHCSHALQYPCRLRSDLFGRSLFFVPCCSTTVTQATTRTGLTLTASCLSAEEQ